MQTSYLINFLICLYQIQISITILLVNVIITTNQTYVQHLV